MVEINPTYFLYQGTLLFIIYNKKERLPIPASSFICFIASGLLYCCIFST